MTVFDQDDTDEDASIEEQIEDAEDIDRSTQASFSSDYKVLGEKDAPGGAGVVGHNTASSGSSYGVEGATDADADAGNGLIPAGVRGAADGAGVVRGVFGEADTKSGRGVVGTANKNSGVQNATLQGTPAGVWGVTDQSTIDSGILNAFGVVGQSTATSGTSFGVLGTNSSPEGSGVYGEDVSGSPDAFGVISDGDSKTEGNHEVTGNLSVASDVDIAGTIKRNAMTKLEFVSVFTVPNSTETKLEFNGTPVDEPSPWDTTDYAYVAPNDGHYEVTLNIKFVSSFANDTSLDLEIKTRANDYLYGWEPTVKSGEEHERSYTTTLTDLSGGLGFEFTIKQDSGNSKDMPFDVGGANATIRYLGDGR